MNFDLCRAFFTHEFLEITHTNIDDFITSIQHIYEYSWSKHYCDIMLKLFKSDNSNVYSVESNEKKIYDKLLNNDLVKYYNITNPKQIRLIHLIELVALFVSNIYDVVISQVTISKLIGQVNLSDNVDHKFNTVYYGNDHKIVVDKNNNYIILITMFFIMLYHVSLNNCVNELDELIKGISTSIIDENKTSLSDPELIKTITVNIFDEFHAFIHMGKEYTVEDVEFKYNVTQCYLLIKSFKLYRTLTSTTDSTNHIDINLLHESCENECMLVKSGSDVIWSNVILSSIYLYKLKHPNNFNVNHHNNFVNRYSNMIVNLGSIFKSRSNYSCMYVLGVLLSLKFIDVSNTANNNEMNHVDTSSKQLTNEVLINNNGACCVALRRKDIKSNIVTIKRNIVVEKQSDAYVVYDVQSSNLYNIVNVYYDLNALNDYVNGREDVLGVINGGSNGENNVRTNVKNNHLNWIMYIVIGIMVLIIVILIVKNEYTADGLIDLGMSCL